MSRFSLPHEFLSNPMKEAASPQEVASFVFSDAIPPDFIHLDYAASTPLDLDVFDTMKPWLFSFFGNPATHVHAMGNVALRGLSEARQNCASRLGVEFDDIVFTASASESNNLFIRGLIDSPRRKRTTILYGATEHSSVLTTLETLGSAPHGRIIAKKIPVDERGQVSLAAAQSLIDSDTLAVCLMDVNNETGLVQESLPKIIDLAHHHGALVHVDAVQGFARGPFSTRALPWDSLTLSAGKIYGPRGAALLALRRRQIPLRLSSQITGGGHEFGLRSSTVNVAGAVGLATAMEFTDKYRDERNAHLENLTRIFEAELAEQIPILIHGQSFTRVPGISMLCIPGINALKLLEVSRRVAFGLGSACKTNSTASQVLLEMGLPLDQASASFRVSFGVPSTKEDAHQGARCLAESAMELLPEMLRRS